MIRKNKSHPCYWSISVACKLEKQPLIDVSDTYNGFSQILQKFLENYLLWRVILVTITLKSFSVADAVFQLLQEFINNFFKDHFTSDFHQAKIKDFDLTSLSAHLFLL